MVQRMIRDFPFTLWKDVTIRSQTNGCIQLTQNLLTENKPYTYNANTPFMHITAKIIFTNDFT